jgi:hypothetical protein
MSIDHKTIWKRYLYPNGMVWSWRGERKPRRLTTKKPAFSMGFRGFPR